MFLAAIYCTDRINGEMVMIVPNNPMTFIPFMVSIRAKIMPEWHFYYLNGVIAEFSCSPKINNMW